MKGIQTIDQAQEAVTYYPVLSMLNTKYIILGANVPPVENNFRLGNAWFVNQIVPVENANGEIETLATVNPATTAVVSKEFLAQESALVKTMAQTAAAAEVADMSLNNSIELASYAPNKLTYNYSSNIPQIVLFSEVYYNPGWSATATNVATGEQSKLEIFRANWILRGTTLPAGEYVVEFKYSPESISKGEMYSRISSGILMLLLLGGVGVCVWRRKGDKK
jgi:hypothetical protein